MESSVHSARTVGIDAIFQYAGSGVQVFSGMIFYVIIVRLFSTSEVGAIALFLAIVGLFNVVFSFGLGTAAQHFTSYHIGKGDFASARRTFYKIAGYGFAFAFLGLFTLLILGDAISLVFLHSTSYAGLVRLLSVVLFGNVLFGILNGLLLGMQNFRLSALINIAIWTIYYFGSIIMAIYLRDLNMIIIGWALGMFSGVVIMLFTILRMIRRFNGNGSSVPNNALIKYSLPVLFSGIISYGSVYIDRFIVAGLLSLSSLGVYNFALLISSSIGFIVVPFNNILMPKFSEFYARNLRTSIANNVKASSLILSSAYVPASLGIASLSPMVIQLLGGHNYLGGTLPLFIIMLSSGFFISQNLLVQALASIRRTHLFIYSSIVALATNITLSILLIPLFGLIGAAIGYSSVFAATFAMLYYFASKEKIVSFDIIGMAKVWFASILMFVVVYNLQSRIGDHLYLLPAYIASGLTVYLICARFLKFFKKEGVDLILSLFPQNYKLVRKLMSTVFLVE